jgi:hypothetical protein
MLPEMPAKPTDVQKMIELVRTLDELEAEKLRLAKELDQKIVTARRQIAALMSTTDKASKLTPSDRLLGELEYHPEGAHYHDLAVAVYGEDGLKKSIGRTSTLLSYLKDKKKVVSLGYGRWSLPQFVPADDG